MVYLDENGLNELWAKIKAEFFRIKGKDISKGSIPYWNIASSTSADPPIQPSFLGLPSSNKGKYVLGIDSTNGVPLWREITPSLTAVTNSAAAYSFKVTVMGNDSSALSLQVADATHAGIVTADTNNAQTFAGQKTFAHRVNIGSVAARAKIFFYDSSGTARDILGFSAGANDDTLLVGYGTNASDGAGTTTRIYGNDIEMAYGAKTVGFKLDSSGNVGIGTSTPTSKLHVAGSIQAVGGGVAANGLADLSVSGSGGGSGTVKEIYIGSTLYPTNVDGKVTLPDYPSDFYTTSQADSIFATQTALGVVTGKIPSAASSSNQLADKAFVNSSISTATATHQGTYNLITDLNLTTSASRSQIASVLGSSVSGADNNDYAFVEIPTSDSTPTLIARVERYKYNGSAWAYEYTLNNSGFTAVQWGAINSGVTSSNWVKTADIKTLTFGSGTTTLVYTPNSGNSRSLLAGSHLSFSISGSNATLNVSDVADSSSASAISTGTSLVSERDVYHGLPTINNAHNYTSDTSIYAPTGGGTAGQYLKSAGGTSTPTWQSFNTPVLSWTESTGNSGPTLNLTPNVGSALSATIPAARKETVNNTDTYYSGIVTTDAQTFVGVKSFDSPIYANVSIAVWADLSSYQDRTPRQDVSIQAIDYPILGTEESNRRGFSFYSYENSPSQTPSSTGIGAHAPMMFGVSGTAESQGGLFFTGSKDYTGTTYSNYWGINTFNPQYRLHINGSFGTNGNTMLAINTGNVGIGNTSPDSKLHVSGTAHVTGDATFDGHAILSKAKFVMSDSSAGNNNVLIGINAYNDLLIGYGRTTGGTAQPIDYSTKIYGTSLSLYYGANRTLGITLDSNGILTNVKSIQSTGGGVAANGIADLALSGGGGGSGTVQSLQVNLATAYTPNTDGVLNLSVSLTGNTTNAISLTLGGSTAAEKSTVSISSANLRTYLNIGQHSDYVTNIGVSGNTLTWSKGGTAQTPITVPYATNAGTLEGTSKAGLFTAFTTASGDSPDTTITIGGTTITRKINADKIDSTHLAEFYKHGRAYCGYNKTEGVTIKPWHLVAEATGTLSDTLQLSISFYVAAHYRESYGILNVYARHQGGRPADDWNIFTLNWTTAVDIKPANFVLTRKVVGDNVTVRLYCNTNYTTSTNNWTSYSFRKLEEQLWGAPRTDLWTMYDSCATNKADGTDTSIGYNYTEIPNDETVQVESTFSDIKNKAADSAKLNGQSASYYATAADYLPLTGGTMTLASIGSLILQRNHATYGAYIQFANNTGVLGCIGVSGVDTPVFRTTGNTNYSLWHAGNTALSVSRDTQDNATSFTIQVGTRTSGGQTVPNDVYVGSIPITTIQGLS